MRIHLGHHFYGAGNLGDDFMLAGLFAALRQLAPSATFYGCVPFDREALRKRFPAVNWLPYEETARRRSIIECDIWLGCGGSPFQHSLSRWFLDHLVGEAALCAREKKPMFYLGVGVQSAGEIAAPEVQRLCTQAARIWTRDAASAERLSSLPSLPPIVAATDLAHVFFQEEPPPAAKRGRLTLVPNFDYGAWPGQQALLQACRELPADERIWLAQESRELPGAERALHATLPPAEKTRWRLIVPDAPTASLAESLARWPSGEWLVTARYHAALAGAWAGSKVVIIATNEKLRAAALELKCPTIAPDADVATVRQALASARPIAMDRSSAERARAACAAFVQAASAIRR